MAKRTVWRGLAVLDSYLGVSNVIRDTANVVLMYHAIAESGEYGNVSAARFRTDLEYITTRFEIVNLPEVLGSGDGKRVALTFDDGFGLFPDEVLPLLREFEVPATVFLVSGCYTDRETGLNAESIMTREQIDGLIEDPLVTLGNHTRTHPKLSTVGSEAELREEIVGGKRDLEREFGVTIDRFSYPSGDFDQRAVRIARRSHEYAVTTNPGLVDGTTDPILVPRVTGHQDRPLLHWEMSTLSGHVRALATKIHVDDDRTTVGD